MEFLSCFNIVDFAKSIKYYINYLEPIDISNSYSTIEYNNIHNTYLLKELLKDNVPPKYIDKLIDELVSLNNIGIDNNILSKYILKDDINNIKEILKQHNFIILNSNNLKDLTCSQLNDIEKQTNKEKINTNLNNILYDVLYNFIQPDEINNILNYIINIVHVIFEKSNATFEKELYNSLYDYFNLFSVQKRNVLLLHINDIITVIKTNIKN